MTDVHSTVVRFDQSEPSTLPLSTNPCLEIVTGYFWVFTGVSVVAITKYLTSVRLHGLTDRLHREHADTSELRQELMGVEEKETQFAKEAERLEAKVQGMRSVVNNLERPAASRAQFRYLVSRARRK